MSLDQFYASTTTLDCIVGSMYDFVHPDAYFIAGASQPKIIKHRQPELCRIASEQASGLWPTEGYDRAIRLLRTSLLQQWEINRRAEISRVYGNHV